MNNHFYPIWEGKCVYDESVLPLQNEAGIIDPIPMMYRMDKILSVRSANLQTTYEEGIDYELEKGRLKILPSGRIQSMKLEEYYMQEEQKGKCFPCTKGGYIYWTETGEFHLRQIVVTYTHTDTWGAFLPEPQGNKLSHILGKMRRREKVNVVFYGDSITAGSNCSSEIGQAPYLERWSQLVVQELKKRFQYDDIIHINTAVGGMTSTWGREHAKERSADKHPDLLCLGFGMNDGHMTTDEYADNIKSIIETTRKENPHCDIVLIATMLPNKEVVGFWGNQEVFMPVLKNIASQYENIAVADMTTMHAELLKRKRLFDMTGNNVNHPNDFLVRVYAQVILETLKV